MHGQVFIMVTLTFKCFRFLRSLFLRSQTPVATTAETMRNAAVDVKGIAKSNDGDTRVAVGDDRSGGGDVGLDTASEKKNTGLGTRGGVQVAHITCIFENISHYRYL